MAKYRAVIIGAGRIGAGWNWHDDAYTHAGAYKALSDRVTLCGVVEPNRERRLAAAAKWSIMGFIDLDHAIRTARPNIVSVCVQPEDQYKVLCQLSGLSGIWCEKPYVSPLPSPMDPPIQVNYLRRADPKHREIAAMETSGLTLRVLAKDDIHTKCHFQDLAKWWRVPMEYFSIKDGPCSYTLGKGVHDFFSFPNGGVDGGLCTKGMLGNLLDHIEKGEPLWSPPA